MIHLGIYLGIVIILFIIYIEYNVGGVLIRVNSKGYKSVNFKSAIFFMIHPLYNKFLWNRTSLDINFIFVLIISIIIYNFSYKFFILKNETN